MKSSTLLFLIALMIPLSGSAFQRNLLINLIEFGRIELQPKGTGIHDGESVEVIIKNTSSSSFSSSIPVGWIFISEVPEVQDLLVVREEFFTLRAGDQTTVLCKAFCCESSGTGPGIDERYRKGRMASPDLVAVAKAASTSEEYADHSIQSAIWVISNGHNISSMGAMDSTSTDTLRLHVSKISGQPAPLYTLTYAEGGEGVCSGRPEWITRNISYNVPGGATITIVAITHDGRIRHVLYDHEELAPGTHEIGLRLNVLDWPEGRYAIRAHSNNEAGARLMNFQL